MGTDSRMLFDRYQVMNFQLVNCHLERPGSFSGLKGSGLLYSVGFGDLLLKHSLGHAAVRRRP